MRLILTIICLFSFQLLNAQELPEKYQDLKSRINETPGKAVDKELEKLRIAEPKDPWVFWLSAINCRYVILKGGKVTYNQEAAYYRKAFSIDPTFCPAYYNLGLLHFNYTEDSLSAAIDLFSKVLENCPDHGYAAVFRGKAHLKQEQFDLAMVDYELTKLSPDMEESTIDTELLIEILYKQGKKEELYQLMRSIDLEEHLGFREDDFTLMMGNIYEEMGEQDNACKCYRNVEELYNMISTEAPKEVQERLKKCPEPKEE